jgi:hypothetical protein
VSLQNSPGLDAVNTPVEQKPRANVYTMMLVVSLCAIIVACVLLWLELKSYGDFPQWDTKGVAPATSWLAPSENGSDAVAKLMERQLA